MEQLPETHQDPNWDALYEELTDQLKSIPITKDSSIQEEALAVKMCLKMINRIKGLLTVHHFMEKTEEIDFNKRTKPKFYSQLIYHQAVYNLLMELPQGDSEAKLKYLGWQIDKINEFNLQNSFLVKYYRSGESSLDEALFSKRPDDLPIALYFNMPVGETSFSASCDYIFYRIRANDFLLDYLNSAKIRFRLPQSDSTGEPGEFKIKWTDAKIYLVELSYAMKLAGSFNHGKAEIKDITAYFEKVFGVDLGNTSKYFQDSLRRKAGYKTYPKRLDEKLSEYTDQII